MIDGFTGGNVSTAQALHQRRHHAPDPRQGHGNARGGIRHRVCPGADARRHARLDPAARPDFVALPAYAAMVMSGGGSAGVVAVPSRDADRREPPADAEVWLHPGRFVPILRKPVMAQLLAISFFSMAAFVMMESTATLFFNDVFGWNKLQIGLYFCYLGVVIILVQGGLIGRLTKRWASGRCDRRPGPGGGGDDRLHRGGHLARRSGAITATVDLLPPSMTALGGGS